MKLKIRIIIIAVTAALLTFAFSLITSNILTVSTVTDIEQDYAARSAKLLKYNIYDEELQNLQKTAADWAIWDETYLFTAGENDAYIDANMGDETFQNLKINAIIIVNDSGDTLFEKFYDYENQAALTLSEYTMVQLHKLIEYETNTNRNDITTTGLVSVDGGLIIFVAHNIFNTDQTKTDNSYMIFAKYFDEQQLDKVQMHFPGNVTLETTPLPIEKVYPEGLIRLDDGVYMRYINKEYYESLVQLHDISGADIAIAHISLPREAYLQSWKLFINFMIYLFLIFVIIVTVMLIITDKSVISKIREMDKTVSYIIKTKDLRQKISLKADDEIMDLADNFNTMMGSLMEYRQQLVEANTILEKSNLSLKELDKTKDEFLSNISHEIRTPMTALKSYAQLLEDGSLGKLTKDQKEAVSIMLESIRHLEMIVNDLLDISKYEAGKMNIHLASTDINRLMKEIISEHKPEIDKAKGTVSLKTLNPDRVINADSDKIKQVMRNLISNAIKFRSDRRLRVDIGLESKNGQVEIKIEDNGIGIDSKNMANLFDKFYQADQSIKRKIPGTGLGLAISKQIISAHGGSIHVESDVDRGTIFTITLPVDGPGK